MSDQPPAVLGDFQLLAKLGAGGMGAVYKARQLSLGRFVALKILPERAAADPEFVQRFIREARATAKLNHPNIVSGIDVGESNGLYYFAMEYVNGTTLRSKIEHEGMLNEREAARIGAAIAAALAHAHASGIVHRDVKPDNILLEQDGTPKLADLGCAKGLSFGHDSSLTQTGTTIGTPHYMSPEQASGDKNIDGRSDIYSLGCTLFHAATGMTPFEEATPALVMVKHINEPIPSPCLIRPDLTEGFCAAVEKMVAKNRDARYRNLTEVFEDLDALSRGDAPPHVNCQPSRTETLNISAKAGGVPRPIKPSRRSVANPTSRHIWPLTIAISAVVVAIVALIAQTAPKTDPLGAQVLQPPAILPPASSETAIPPSHQVPSTVTNSTRDKNAPAVSVDNADGNLPVPRKYAMRHWVAKTAGKFSSTANWAIVADGAGGASVPGSRDIAVFSKARGTGDCELDRNLDVAGIQIDADYGAKITQEHGVCVNVGTANYCQAGGSFSGGELPITLKGAFTLSGGTFTSTSGNLAVAGAFTISGAPTFMHNNGTVTFASASRLITPSMAKFNNVNFNSGIGGTKTIANNNTLTVLGTLALINGSINQATIPTAGSIVALGDISQSSTFSGGTAEIVIGGSGPQTFAGSATTTAGGLPSINFNSTGAVSLTGTIRTSKNWTYTAGTIKPGTSTVVFAGNTVTGSHALGNITFAPTNGATLTIASGTTLTALGTLTLTDAGSDCHINTGTLAAQGDIKVADAGYYLGTGTILINGSGNQTLTGNATQKAGWIPAVIINKPGGTLLISGVVRTTSNWTYMAGTINAGSSTVVFSGSQTVTGSHTLNNVIVDPATTTSATLTLADGTTLTASGNLLLDNSNTGTAHVSTGMLAVQGNLTTTSKVSTSGNASVSLTGANNQTIKCVNLPKGTFSVNKSGGTATLASDLFANGSLQNMELTAGTLDLAGFNLTVQKTLTIGSPGALRIKKGEKFELVAGNVVNNGTILVDGKVQTNEQIAKLYRKSE